MLRGLQVIGRSRPLLLAMACTTVLAGCSKVPDAINPVEWYNQSVGSSSDSAGQTGDAQNDLQADRGKAPPGSDQSFPTLSRVDQQVAARDNRASGLSADVEGRQYAESVSRQGTSGAQSSLYADDKPPAAPQVTAQTPAAPAAAPKPAVSVAKAPEPVATPQPAAQPQATVSSGGVNLRPPSEVASTTPSGPNPSYGVDPGMGERLAQQLAEIRARAADQGSLIPLELASGGTGSPTVIVSSGGIETTSFSSASGLAFAPVASQGAVANQGALPIPNQATRVATIQFRNGSSALSAADRRILADVARLAQKNNGTLRVVGHASQRTRNMSPERHNETNFQVSQKRAERVAGELRRLGMNASNVLVAAVGANEPVYLEVMPSGEAGNRRAEIYLSN